MAHGGISKSFWDMLKETSMAFFFDVIGLFAGFLVASQLGVFRLSPWAIALYPAVIGSKSVIEGLLSGRLSTALHLGTVYPRFFGNTRSFYTLIDALVVLNLATGVAMSAFALFLGNLFWRVTIADFPAILSVVVATMSLGLTFFLVTVKVAFISFKRGLDPDIVVYPVMTSVAGILVTAFYIVALNLFFSFGIIGKYVIIVLGLVHVLLVGYVSPRNLREQEFIKTLRESFAAIIIVSFMVNVTGTILRRISVFAANRREIYTVYPALISMVSDVGSVVGSTATTKLALGLLTPAFSSIRHHAKNIFSAWTASIIMFILLAASALAIHGLFSLPVFYSFLYALLITNIAAVAAIIVLSYAVSILTFKKGLDPGNFVIPIESAFSASLTSIALLTALLLIR